MGSYYLTESGRRWLDEYQERSDVFDTSNKKRVVMYLILSALEDNEPLSDQLEIAKAARFQSTSFSGDIATWDIDHFIPIVNSLIPRYIVDTDKQESKGSEDGQNWRYYGEKEQESIETPYYSLDDYGLKGCDPVKKRCYEKFIRESIEKGIKEDVPKQKISESLREEWKREKLKKDLDWLFDD